MAKYSKLGNIYNNQRLGSFEMHGVSNTFGNQFGNFGQSFGTGTGWSPTSSVPDSAVEACIETPFTRQGDQALINCYFDLESVRCTDQRRQPCSVQFATELRARGYDLQSGQWQKKAKEQGTSAGEVLTGIAAILNPLATAGVGIYASQLQAKQTQQCIKAGGRNCGAQPQGSSGGSVQTFTPPADNTGVIIAVVVLMMFMMGMMMFMMNKKK